MPFLCRFCVGDLSDFLRSTRGSSGWPDSLSRSRNKERISCGISTIATHWRSHWAVNTVVCPREGASTGTIQITSEFCEALSAAFSWRGAAFCCSGQEARREQRLSLWHKLGQSCAFSAPSGACPCSGARHRSSGRRAGRITPEYFDAIVIAPRRHASARWFAARKRGTELPAGDGYGLRPRTTELLRIARRARHRDRFRGEMFLAQGFAQYEIWTGEAVRRKPPCAVR